MIRLLVLDGSQILSSLVHRLAPGPVEVEEVATFDEAVVRLENDPPDALIVNVGPAALPWRRLKVICADHKPKIPVLFESCVYETPLDAGIGSLNHSAAFLPKPYGVEQLRTQLERLIDSGGDDTPRSGAHATAALLSDRRVRKTGWKDRRRDACGRRLDPTPSSKA